MKYIFILISILIPGMLFSQVVNPLEISIQMEFKNTPVKEAIEQICRKYTINYAMASKEQPKHVTAVFKNEKLRSVLDQLIKNTSLEYVLQGDQLIFREKKKVTSKYTFNGYVEDRVTKERLIGCTIVDSVKMRGVVTNAFGFFSFDLDEGSNAIQFRYMGYTTRVVDLALQCDTMMIVSLTPAGPQELGEVKVTADVPETKLSHANMGYVQVSRKEMRQFPSLLGEADVLRSVQMYPGVQAANERSTGLSVRGGSIDQNLFLLDDAPVYQTSHMSGFYSVFNIDAVKDVKVYKGDIPANYGGRVSSLVDVRLKDGNMQKYSVSGGLGPIAADLSVEGPIIRNKASFIVSAKKSILSNYFFQSAFTDLNLKLNMIVNDKNRIYLSSYHGKDISEVGTHFTYRNNTVSLRWNHIYNPRLFSNISLIYSKYAYQSGNTGNVNQYYNYLWKSGIAQLALKADYTYYLHNNTIDFGISTTYHKFNPGTLEGSQTSIETHAKATPFSNRVVCNQGTLDHAIYVSNEQKLTSRLSFRYGVRGSVFRNIGNDNWVFKLQNYQVVDSFKASRNSFYHNFFSVEPRLGLNYRLSNTASVKASFNYATQQIQLLTKTNGGGPMDVWYPSGYNIKPQKQWQYSVGYIQYLFGRKVEFSAEGYYKKMENIADYKDGATFLDKSSIYLTDKTNYNFEEQLRTGKGFAYGAEFMVKGDFTKLSGFVSYTYCRSKRTIEGINNGSTYLSPFDKPHTLNAFLNYQVSNRFSASANWRYQSGMVITAPVYIMEMYGKVIKGYSNRNEFRLPAYSRFDVSLTLKSKQKEGRRFQGEWNLSIVNMLDHLNYESIDFVVDKENPEKIKMMGNFYFEVLPSLSYHFTF
ncbi:MAG TPA: carboxypeptidase-like regulatory domain-containing protein [Bacteroidales bacterium]|nr:carboxypeptidase-like regulatory domain-containing protein [Bacteroidales bacterium]